MQVVILGLVVRAKCLNHAPVSSTVHLLVHPSSAFPSTAHAADGENDQELSSLSALVQLSDLQIFQKVTTLTKYMTFCAREVKSYVMQR